AGIGLPGATLAPGLADRLRTLVDDLERVVQVVEIPVQSGEDLLEGVEGGLLLAGLVGPHHGLQDTGGVSHLVLPFRLTVAKPTEGSAETLKDWHARNVSLQNAQGKRKLMWFNDLRDFRSTCTQAIYCLTWRLVAGYSCELWQLVIDRRSDPSTRHVVDEGSGGLLDEGWRSRSWRKRPRIRGNTRPPDC